MHMCLFTFYYSNCCYWYTSISSPSFSSPSDKTTPPHCLKLPPPLLGLGLWFYSYTHFFILALWLFLLIKKRKLSWFEIQEKRLRPSKWCFYWKSRVSQATVEVWAMQLPCKVTLQRCGNLNGGEHYPAPSQLFVTKKLQKPINI